jgi:hypothetical protein
MLSNRKSLFYSPIALLPSGILIATERAMQSKAAQKWRWQEMNRTTGFKASALILILLIISASGLAQARNKSKLPARAFTPRVRAYSDSAIINGRISSIETGRLIIKTTQGPRVSLEIDDNTTMLEAGELVSFASMGDIALSVGDLRISDSVEIVVERAGSRQMARIITRTRSADAMVARH